MAIIQCPACGRRVSNKAATCPNCGEPIKNKNSIFTWVVLVLVLFYFAGTIFNNESDKTTSYTKIDETADPKKLDTKKLEDMLEYALIKDENNDRVRCKSKFTHGREYILCTYSVMGYKKSSLFFSDKNGVVAVNGTAKKLSNYNEIRNYNYDTDGNIDIPSIIDSF